MRQVFRHGRLRLYLLKLLAESPRHGYDVIRDLEDRFMGLYAPSAGTVYPRLARLEAEGLVEHSKQAGRKVFQITEAGRSELAARRADVDDIEADIAGSVHDLAQEIRADVHGSVKDLRAELRAAASGTSRKAIADPRVVELLRLAEHVRGEVGELVRRRAPADDDLAALRTRLEAAAAEARRIIRSVS